jgi:hypothetical protein
MSISVLAAHGTRPAHSDSLSATPLATVTPSAASTLTTVDSVCGARPPAPFAENRTSISQPASSATTASTVERVLPDLAASEGAMSAYNQVSAVDEFLSSATSTVPSSTSAPINHSLSADISGSAAAETTAMDVDALPHAPLTLPLPNFPDLYKIPKEELEVLIGEIVREDGFVKLVGPAGNLCPY